MNARGSGGYRVVVRPESFAVTAAAFLGRVLAKFPPDRPIDIAISGGTTPGPVYRRLAEAGSPAWERARIFFVDERAVPRDHPQSNYRLALETLVEPAGIAAERVFPMIPDGFVTPTPEVLEGAALAYEQVLPDRFDVVVLGLGGDGHTAAIFPGAELDPAGSRRVMPTVAPSPPFARLTLAPALISGARVVVVLVAGPSKADAVEAALSPGPIKDVPGRMAAGGVWIIGADAVRRPTEDRRPSSAVRP